MSETVKIFYYGLWILHPLLQTAIAVAMYRRGLMQRFRFFFAYILTQIVSFFVVFPAYIGHSYAALFYLYWSTTAVSITCGFLVIHEVFVDVFRTFHTLRDLGTVLFKWAGLVMLLVAGVVSISNTSSRIGPFMQALLTTQRCVRVVQVGMILFLLFFAHYVGVSRRQHSFGIALGFGSFAVIELVLISSWVGNHLTGPGMNIVNMIAYNTSLVTWLTYVAVKRPARDLATSLLQPQRWEQSLSDIHHPVPADSLIPMFEGMVERALSRTHAQEPAAGATESASAPAARAAAAADGFAAILRAASKG